PVASKPPNVTCWSTSQSRSSSSALVVVAKVRISWRRERRPVGLGVRTHALRSFLPMSNPAHRSCKTSIFSSSRETGQQQRGRPEEPQGLKSLTRVLKQQSTVPVGGPQHHPELRAHRHHSEIGVPDGRTPIFPPPRRPSEAAQDTASKIAVTEAGLGELCSLDGVEADGVAESVGVAGDAA